MAQIHATAIVEEGAILADDVVIDAYSFVSKDATLKSGVSIGQGAQVCGIIEIGENTKIFPYAIVGSVPQDLKYEKGEISDTVIGKNCTIREFATINRGTVHGGGRTKIGNNILVMNYCHIAHDCQLEDDIIMSNNATLAGHVEVGRGTIIGGLTPVHQFVKIGQGCMIAGASALSQDIPPYCLAEGNRAKVRGLNLVGLRRKSTSEDLEALRHAFKTLFKESESLKAGAEQLLKNSKNEKVKQMCQFILETKRGIPYERQDI